ncbi:MAG: MFS transporter [Actinobacteria bacterium]|nr:MFS transporter [Actinomycetota bacterium]
MQKRTVKVLATTQVLSGVGVAGTVAAGSLLVSSISNSETLAGLSQTTSVLGAAAMAIPLSKLTQRGGRRLGLSVGYTVGLIGAAFAIFGGSQKNLVAMLIGTFLVGAASASGYQARFAATDLAEDEHRSKQLSYVVWGSTVGAVTGPNLMEPAGALAESLGLPKLVGPYILAMITLGLAVTVIRLFLKPDPYLTASNIRNADNEKAELLSAKKTLAIIRKNPKALFAIAAIAIGHVAMVSVMVMTPVHMAHVDVTLKVIGFVISVHILGMYAFSPIVGSLSDRFGRKSVIQLGVLILLLSTIIAGAADANDSFSLGFGLFLLGLGWSCTLIGGSTLLSESVETELRPSSQGASDLLMNLMGAGGGAIAGVVIGTLGYGWLCLFAAVPVAALGVWSFAKTLSD